MTDLTHLIGRLRELADHLGSAQYNADPWASSPSAQAQSCRQAADALAALAARVGELEGALGDLVSWFTTPMIDGRVWLIPAGERGANDAVDNARKALNPVEGE